MANSKGISPLIAAVLLIAFTMAVATIAGPWMTNLLQNTQQGTTQQAIDINRASELGLEIMSIEFNRSSDQLEVFIQNKGEPINNNTNVSIAAIGGSVAKTQQYDLDLGSREIKTLDLPVDRTYPLETVKADLTNYPVSAESGVKCTPTEGLVGYWTFNEEQTQNGYAIDLSGQGNNGSLHGGITTRTGRIGEAYNFDDNDNYVEIPHSSSLTLKNGFTVMAFAKREDGSETDQIFSKRNNQNIEFQDEGSSIKYYFSDEDESVNQVASVKSTRWNLISLSGNNKTEIELLVNGNQKRSTTLTDYNYTGDQNIFIGSDRNPPKEPYSGKIDETRIYNRALPQQEIQRLYEVRSEEWAVSGCKLIH